MNHSPFPRLAIATLALASFSTAQEGARKITISPKAGEVVVYRSTQTQKQTMEAMGQESINEIVTDLKVAVDEVAADGTVKVTATWLRLRGNLQSMMGEMQFDTKKPEDAGDNPMLEGFAEGCTALINQKTVITFGPDGKLKDKKPLEELAQKLTDKLTGQAKMIFQGIVGVHVLEGQVSVFGTFPQEPVATGGTWTEKKDMGGRGGLNMQSEVTHKLASAGDDMFVIATTGTLTAVPPKEKEENDKADDDEGAAMMRNMMRDAKIKNGKVEAESKVSRKDGLLLSSTNTSQMEIHMTNPMGGDEPFVVGVKQSTKVERAKEEADAKDSKGAPASPKK